MYTSAVWNVKAGMAEMFERGWQSSVDRMSVELPNVTFRLLRDTQNPSRFVSVAGPWKGPEQWDAVRSSEGFQSAMAAMADVLESSEMATYDLVVEVS
jgi:quinol monooxygenase YgiN